MLAIRMQTDDNSIATAVVDRELGAAVILRYDTDGLLTSMLQALKGMSVPKILIHSLHEPNEKVVGSNCVRSPFGIWEVKLK